MYAVELAFKNNVELVAFVHEPGAEIWTYTGYWPSKPTIHELGSESGLVDFAVEKSIFHKSQNCNEDPEYKLYGKQYHS